MELAAEPITGESKKVNPLVLKACTLEPVFFAMPVSHMDVTGAMRSAICGQSPEANQTTSCFLHSFLFSRKLLEGF